MIDRQVVARFSQGIFDREIAQQLMCQRPATLSKALQDYKVFVFAKQAANAKPKYPHNSVRGVLAYPTADYSYPARDTVQSYPTVNQAVSSTPQHSNNCSHQSSFFQFPYN